ncbi:DDE-type integrase/transposase/recombinase [Geotalea sp. SG265]|uniref:Mu transposase C-terminal domain-containing protein n=1 Tax=Geotalea sp. SG265 TaxID=2922867 RepID=UPI001FAFA10F|nr:DDE-type integrase/transposase/recombinase [Geotalea sp. SG265]
MLTDDEFFAWCLQNNISEEAKRQIQRVRKSEPSRRVSGKVGNVTGKFPSRKMGKTIQFESHTVELPFIATYENDDDVLEYYDQPNPIKLIYENKKGRKLGVIHTCDFFVIRRHSAGWEECKNAKKLLELQKKEPNRYFQDDDGIWRCPPGERSAETYGLYYRLRSTAEINQVHYRNMVFLSDYLNCESLWEIDEKVKTAITAMLSIYPGILLRDLIFKIEEQGGTADDIYWMLLYNQLYIDIYTFVLAEPHRTKVYINEATSTAYSMFSEATGVQRDCLAVNVEPGTRCLWDGRVFEVILAGNTEVMFRDEESKIAKLPFTVFEQMVMQGSIIQVKKDDQLLEEGFKILNKATEDCLKIANSRMDCIRPYLNGEVIVVGTSTIYRWLRQYRKAEAKYGIGYLGLLPRHKDKGNEKPKLEQETLDLIIKFIEEELLNKVSPNVKVVHARYQLACEEQGCIAASDKTFRKVLNTKYRKVDQVYRRKGKKAGYQFKETYLCLEYHSPRHGDWPFHIAHIDHTELDLFFVDSKTLRVVLGKAWLTLMIDANTRMIIGWYLSFEPPSYRSCMMVVMDCVKRHKRIPHTIVLDGGKEFGSVYFETLLAMSGAVKKSRPPAEGRFGSVLERLFGTINTQYIYNLEGNNQILKVPRQATKKDLPDQHAIWPLPEFAKHFERWINEYYHMAPHPALAMSPLEAYAAGLQLTGNRTQNILAFDQRFLFRVLPTTTKKTAKVCFGKGVKINNIYYKCAEFSRADIEGTSVEVRYNPFNIGIAYAYIKKRGWVTCYSEHYAELKGYTERELQYASAEIRKKKNLPANKQISAKLLAEFLRSAKEHENVLKEMRQKAQESMFVNKNLLDSLIIEPDQELAVSANRQTTPQVDGSKVDSNKQNPTKNFYVAEYTDDDLYEELA